MLDEEALSEVAAHYDEAGVAWQRLLDALLPTNVGMLGHARELIDRQTATFIDKGGADLETIVNCRDELAGLHKLAEDDFPLGEDDIATIRENLSECVALVEAAENRAVLALKSVCATIDSD